jgi:hypothetical protein
VRVRPLRIVAISVAALLWCAIVYGIAVRLTLRTEGENVGKFVGTIFSAVAFAPPVLLFLKWYRKHEGNSAIARRPSNITLDTASTGSEPGPQAKLSE